MESLKTVALGAALIAGLMVAALITFYALQLVVRGFLHPKDFLKPLPPIDSLTVGALTLKLADSAKLTDQTVAEHEKLLVDMDRYIGKLAARLAKLEQHNRGGGRE